MNIMDYLGKPWANGASGPDSFDCWGLVRAVYSTRGIELPVVDVDAHRALEVRHAFAIRDNWALVDTPSEFSAVLMSKSKHPDHVGVWLPENGGAVLHSIQGAGVVLSNKMALKLMGFNVLGFYRWGG